MKTAKVREQMVRFKTGKYTIRFWMSRHVPPNTEISNLICKIRDRLDFEPFEDTNAVADYIGKALPEDAPVAAVEVILNHNHGGTVDYYDWP